MRNNKILVCNQMFEGAVQKGNLYFSGELYEKDGHCFYFKHLLYEIDKTIEEYFEIFMKDKYEFVKCLKGEFCLVDYDVTRNILFFATDHLGKEAPLVYQNGQQLLITNDFWHGIEIIKPQECDIDWQVVKEKIVCRSAVLPGNTIVKNYQLMPAGSLAEVNLEEDIQAHYRLYWKLEFKPNRNVRIEDAAQKVYDTLDNTFALLAKKYPKNTKFGIGISGGWDSRLVIAFAKKHNLKLVPFCIGEKYSIFPFHTDGYQVVKRLAKYFQLDNLTFIPHDKESYIKKVADDVLLSPNKGSEIEISNSSSEPDFDIMLNGEHGSEIFGYPPDVIIPLMEYDKSDIWKYLIKYLSWTDKTDMILNEEEWNCSKRKVKDYIKDLEAGELKLEEQYAVFYYYYLKVLTPWTKYGFFESNYGKKERYSAYLNPDLFEQYLSWDPMYFVNRSLQRKVFMTYFPELSKMSDESPDAPLYWRGMNIRNVPYRFAYALKKLFLKSSLRREVWLKRDKGFHQLYRKVLKENAKYVDEHFPNLDAELFLKTCPRPASNMVKLLVEVDLILHSNNKKKREYIVKKYGK